MPEGCAAYDNCNKVSTDTAHEYLFILPVLFDLVLLKNYYL